MGHGDNFAVAASMAFQHDENASELALETVGGFTPPPGYD